VLALAMIMSTGVLGTVPVTAHANTVDISVQIIDLDGKTPIEVKNGATIISSQVYLYASSSKAIIKNVQYHCNGELQWSIDYHTKSMAESWVTHWPGTHKLTITCHDNSVSEFTFFVVENKNMNPPDITVLTADGQEIKNGDIIGLGTSFWAVFESTGSPIRYAEYRYYEELLWSANFTSAARSAAGQPFETAREGSFYITVRSWDSSHNSVGFQVKDFGFVEPVAPAPVQNQAAFTDVPSKHWAYSYIQHLAANDVINGYPDGSFRPGELVTRKEFAKIMAQALGIPLQNPNTPSFIDISRKSWEYPYVETAKRYLTGYQDGNNFFFKGDEPAVREDMAVALVKALQLENEVVLENEITGIFSDHATISNGLQRYVLIAYKNGLIDGYPDGTFRAQQSITRAETAALLIKVLESKAMKKVVFE